jgi:hypothetical protein
MEVEITYGGAMIEEPKASGTAIKEKKVEDDKEREKER